MMFDVFDNRELDDVLDFICMMGIYHNQKARYLNFKHYCKIFTSDLLFSITFKNLLP